ncbi:hypothetical protein, partial [Streptococcus pneumoniae]
QKRKDEICPFSSLAFFQPTTVDKEPQSSVYPRKFIKTKILPKNFWQETKSIYQFLSIAYRSQRLVNRDSAIKLRYSII